MHMGRYEFHLPHGNNQLQVLRDSEVPCLKRDLPAVVVAPRLWRCREEGLETNRLREEAIDVQACLLIFTIQARTCQRICSNYKAMHVHAAFSSMVFIKPRLQQRPFTVVSLSPRSHSLDFNFQD